MDRSGNHCRYIQDFCDNMTGRLRLQVQNAPRCLKAHTGRFVSRFTMKIGLFFQERIKTNREEILKRSTRSSHFGADDRSFP
jgi:hypothetical protein